MAGDAVATTFITGADGFIGTELVKVLTARGHQVFGLTRSIEGAQRVRRAGVEHSTTRDWLPLSLSHARARASKFSEHSMSTELCRLATTSELGQSFDFDEVVLPLIDAGYRLAHWLMRNEHDAEDVVQDASLRAFRYFRTFMGGDGRAWFLRIVRNTCSGWRGHRYDALNDPFDEEQHGSVRPAFDPEALLLQADDATLIARAMRTLPDRSHRLLVLRELEGLSYRELADAMEIPIGTVMSRLSRAREALRGALESELTPPRMSGRTKASAEYTDSLV